MTRSRRPILGFGAWWDAKQADTGDLWHRTLIDPGLFSLLGALPRGTRVLEVGCGNGYLARRLARAGCEVVGVDRSHPLIVRARARESANPLGVVYLEQDAARMRQVRSASFDVALANMSLMDIEDAEGTVREVARALRPGGRFVFSISHPCFDVDRRSAWTVEVALGRTEVYRKVTDYLRPHAEEFDWPLDGGRVARTIGYHRPLSWYARALRSAGFVLLDVHEPTPGPGFASRRMDRGWFFEVPLHLVVAARREPGPGSRPTDPAGRAGAPRRAPSRRGRPDRAPRRAPHRGGRRARRRGTRRASG